MFENWSLSQYLVRFLAINHWVIGILLGIFGIATIFISKIINKIPFILNNVQVTGPVTGIGVLILIFGIYFCVMAYGLWNYKNYARIMQLILFYLLGVGVLIYLIVTIITLFTSPLLGIILLIITAYFALIVYMLIYLFQVQKDMIALFKGY